MIKPFLKSRFFLSVLMLSVGITASAEYYISICIKGAPHQKVIFTAYYGVQSYIIDSATLDEKGNAIFQSKEKSLMPGLYSLILSDKHRADVIIDKEQNLTVSTDTADMEGHMQVEGSKESALFTDYVRYLKKYESEKEDIQKQMKNSSADSVSYYRLKLKETELQMNRYNERIMADNPNTVLSLYAALSVEPIAPSVNVDSSSLTKAFAQRYQFMVGNYFKHIDLTNETLIRIPQFADRLMYFFNRLIVQNSDTIKFHIDKILRQCEDDKEMYRFVLRLLFQNYYEKFESKTYEPCFIYLADEYYKKGKADWAKDQFLKLLAGRVDQMRPTLYGAKAPELKLQDPNGKKIFLSQVKAPYTVLYFYEYDCGRCKQETPKLAEIYKNYKGKIEVVAVYMHADRVRWLQYIEDNKLKWINASDPVKENKIKETYFIQRVPCIFLLDKDKRIIEKKISADELNTVLQSLLK